jgi:cardiolipin synthase
VKLFRKLFSRVVLFSLGIALQLAWLFFMVFFLSSYYLPIALFFSLVSLLAVVYIIDRPGNPQVKMAWIVPILVFPLFGGIIFFISGGKRPKKKLRRALEESGRMLDPLRRSNLNVDFSNPATVPARREDRYLTGQCHYLDSQGFPVYRDTDADYYADCRRGWERLLEDLRGAERFIFMEYFIVKPGVMWDPVLEILREKAAAGVEVRLMYDDVGSIGCLPRDYAQKLNAMGIKCVQFNPYRPVYAVVMNHRDHRKITVIDGHIGYTGGANFADEYIGEEERFGEWRDNLLRLEGEAVRSLTLLFLEMWNAVSSIDNYRKRCFWKPDTLEEAEAFMPDPTRTRAFRFPGLVQPYGDSPVDDEVVAENVYLNVINQATDYLYVLTPYLVIDYEMTRALCLAARRGVDVRLAVPGIPDKKTVYHLAKSYFPELMENGVKLYRFTPGFLHSKVFVADDRQAVVGTVNLDYRSLTLHFENACMFVDHPVIPSVKADVIDTLDRCEPVTLKDRRYGALYSLYLGLLRLFAPLM